MPKHSRNDAELDKKIEFPILKKVHTDQHNQPSSAEMTANKSIAVESTNPLQTKLTVEEAKLYDRQIRLWGMEAQQRMRNARILVVGCTGLSNEVLKNIVLAGVGAVTIADSEVVQAKDLGSQFFLRDADIGKNKAESVLPRIQELNPRVRVNAVSDDINGLPDTFFTNYDIVCAIGQNPDIVAKINTIVRVKNILFWSASIFGTFGYMFSDLQDYRYSAISKSADSKEPQHTPAQLLFCSFEQMLSTTFNHPKIDKRWRRRAHPLYFAIRVVWEYWMKHRRYPDINMPSDLQELNTMKLQVTKLLECDGAFVEDELVRNVANMVSVEVSASCAVLGGILAQELLKALSRNDSPIHNVLLYDSWEAIAQVMKIMP
ncbi:hypothetical protein BDV3_000431 [Batrachochytrium dendrobatidis]